MKVYLKNGTVESLNIPKGSLAQYELFENFDLSSLDLKKTTEEYKKDHPESKLLLVLDDDIIITESFEGYCAMANCFCLKANTPEEAYSLWKDYPFFDIIITDRNMPGMSGDDFARIIKSMNENVRIALLTGEMGSLGHLEKIDIAVKKPLSFELFKTSVLGR